MSAFDFIPCELHGDYKDFCREFNLGWNDIHAIDVYYRNKRWEG